MTHSTAPIVRSVYWAARVPGAEAPFDTVHLRITYPARRTDSEAERMSGEVAAAADLTPMPVVIVAPGVNVGADAYAWIGHLLAPLGFAVVTYQWVGELFAGMYGITPGVDIAAVTPDGWGTAPPLSGLAPVFDGLADANERCAPLTGALDLSTIVLGGHSGGGTVALESSRHAYVPGLRATFTYAAHTMVATQLGWPPDTLLPVGDDVPVLIAGGTADGVIAASRLRYGTQDQPWRDPMVRTFDEAVTRDEGDSYLLMLDGAGHFAAVDPHDTATARGFLEEEPSMPDDQARELFGGVLVDFLASTLRGDHEARARLGSLVANPPSWAAELRQR